MDLHELCVVEFLLLSQVFCLHQVVSDRSGLDRIDQVQNRYAAADGPVLQTHTYVLIFRLTRFGTRMTFA